MRFSFIDQYQGVLTQVELCALLEVSDRGYRAWLARPISRRQRDDMVILAHIREHHRLSMESYGRPRMTEELKNEGIAVWHRRVGRLMRQNGIMIARTHKFKATTDSAHSLYVAPNILNRDFTASGPDQKWAGDITYIWTAEGWLYLAVSNRMKKDLAIRALQMAINLRRPPPGCIHHTHRGSQYCAKDYRKILRQHAFEVSMSRKGNCWDNAVSETFFKSLKAELIWRQQ